MNLYIDYSEFELTCWNTDGKGTNVAIPLTEEYEWRKAYRDKEELMLERGFPEVSPHEFYRDLFPEGSLQSAEHDGKGNLIATRLTRVCRRKWKNRRVSQSKGERLKC